MNRLRSNAGLAVLAAALSLLVAILVLRLWRADLAIPFEYYGDANLQHLLLKGVLDRGWYFEHPALGAPHGLELYDYPVANGETLNLVVAGVLGLLGLGTAAALNVLYLLGFPLVGLTAFLALRRLGASQGSSLVCAVLYAVLPYHFIRGETHLFLSTYYAVPAGAYLALAVLGGDRIRLVAAVALAALVGTASGSFYYAAFTILLVVVAAALRYLAVRDRRAVVTAGVVVGAVLAVSLLQLAPTLVYRAANGTNDEVAQRYRFESEVYSLKLTQLVLPIDEHRIGPLARLKQEYTEKFPPLDANAASLGVVGTAGFAWLLAVVLGAIAGRRAPGRHAALAGLALVAFLLGTIGGAGTLVAVVFDQMRAWNRLSIFIAFFALAAVALGLDALGRRVGRPAFVAALAAVLIVGVFDQTSRAFIPRYEAVGAEWKLDAAFFSSLEDRLPSGASVVQLPYEPFPEPATVRQAIYEPAKAYLHADGLRWSYGAIRGRDDDWAAVNATKPAAELVRAAREARFSGILVDRLAYPDDGAAAEAELRQALGAAPERSTNTRFLFWRL